MASRLLSLFSPRSFQHRRNNLATARKPSDFFSTEHVAVSLAGAAGALPLEVG